MALIRAEHSDPLPSGPKSPAAWQLLRYSRTPLEFLEECSHRYGDPFTLRLAGYGKLVMLSSPDAVQDVFRGDARSLHAGEGNEFLSVTLGQNSVIVLDEEPHARQRRVLLPPLKGERMRSFFFAMREATLETMEKWPRNKPLAIVESTRHITLRVILRSVLGLPVGPELEDFEAKTRDLLRFSRGRYSLIGLKFLPLSWMRRVEWMPYFRQLRALDEAIFRFIDRVRAAPLAERGANIVAELLESTHEQGQTLSNQEIRDAVLTLLVAGHDTTSLAIAWAMERTCEHEDVARRVVEELDAIVGDRLLELEDLDRLTYLDATIRESLRTRTILPFVTRLTKVPFRAGGREYPPGVLLCPCLHLTHLREDLYPEPKRFRPERFLERKYSANEWYPFGGGNRMCLGMAFALFEMKTVLAVLYSRSKFTRPAGAHSYPIRQGISLAPHDGARVIVTPRT